MPDRVMTNYPFQGDTFRERISLAREYCVVGAAVTTGDSLSEEVDVRRAAGAAVEIDNTTSATHIAVYASAEQGGMKRPVYDPDDELLIVTVEDGIVVLPAEIFPLGFISLALCSDSDGTLTSDQADLLFLVILKP